MKKMKAGVLIEPYHIELREIDIPKIGVDDVLIKVKAVGICGTDLKIYRGKFKWAGISLPIVLGHEIAGIISEKGKNVKNFKIGERIVVRSTLNCGRCFYCITGRNQLCDSSKEIGFSFKYRGGFSEYILVPSTNICTLPNNISFIDGSFITCIAEPLQTIKKSGIEIGDSVAVLGCGSIGLSFLQLANIKGAYKVIVTGTRDRKLSIAKDLGADETVNVRKENTIKKILELTDGQGVNVAIEASGSPSSFLNAIKMVRKGGKILVFGVPNASINDFPIQEVTMKEISIIGTQSTNTLFDFEEAIDLLLTNKINITPIITHTFPLENISKAFNLFDKKRDEVVKIVLTN